MKKVLIPLLAVHTLLTLIAGSLFFLQVNVGHVPTLGDREPLLFLGAMILSPFLALIVARLGPQRPEGLLRLEDPFDAQARLRAKNRLKTILRVIWVGFLLGLIAALFGSLTRHFATAGGLLLACSGCLMVVLAPWVALYARWFRIGRF